LDHIKLVKRFQKEQIIYIFDDIVEKGLKKIVCTICLADI